MPQEALCEPALCSHSSHSPVEQPEAFQEVVLFIPKLPLRLCVNESHDSFSINSVGEQKGKKSKGWGLAFRFVETAKAKLFSSFWHPSEKRPSL